MQLQLGDLGLKLERDLLLGQNRVRGLGISGCPVPLDLEGPLFDPVLLSHLEEILEPVAPLLDDLQGFLRQLKEVDGHSKARLLSLAAEIAPLADTRHIPLPVPMHLPR